VKRRILAIDPGLKTGMSAWEIEGDGEPVLVWSAELDEAEYAPQIRVELADHPDLEIVCERFIINAQTAKKSQSGWSLELIGVLKQCLRDVGRPVEDIKFQNPSDAMNMFPNPALKKLGYWHRGGAGHALDSMRHGLLYLVKTKWKPARLLD
jgi:hypothetical protein